MGQVKSGCIAPRIPINPPLVESEAAYLRRHGLVSEAEMRRLGPEAFEPDEVDCSDDAPDNAA
jgi:hypothetical protein